MVGGWVGCCGLRVLLLYSCTAIALSCCYFRLPPPARSVDRAADRSPSPSPGRPLPLSSIARRRPIARSTTVARPPSLARRHSPAVTRPPSLARRRRRRSGGLWPPSSLARRCPLVRSFARRHSPSARPPPLLSLLTLCQQVGELADSVLCMLITYEPGQIPTLCYDVSTRADHSVTRWYRARAAEIEKKITLD